jgi:hypothetical protein
LDERSWLRIAEIPQLLSAQELFVEVRSGKGKAGAVTLVGAGEFAGTRELKTLKLVA